jgi:glyoxylase-like metal-dependent hydrolase (beta-lactamase superfamily II)
MNRPHTLLLASFVLATLASCQGPKLGLMRRGFNAAATDYFADGTERFDTVAPGVHSFRDGFDRDLIVETSAGLVVVDPYNPGMSAKLAAQLQQRFPGKPVTHLIYSHYHLDHASGGAALAPREVIAHQRCPDYWRDLDARDVVPPTRLVEGDVDLELGGVPVRLIDLGKSHTDTLYAVYLPRQKVLFAADLTFVRALPPAGHPDFYRPGLLRALDRVAALDFDAYVPSHFDAGNKADFLAGKRFYDETARLVREASAGAGRRLLDDAPRFQAAADHVFDTLYPTYGPWRGGGPMLLLFVQRNFVGEFLGY